MEKLELLKKEMLEAKEAYETFKTNNSRELTDDEKKNEQSPIFIGVDIIGVDTEARMFELTKELVEEMGSLEKNMLETYKSFVKYVNSKQK